MPHADITESLLESTSIDTVMTDYTLVASPNESMGSGVSTSLPQFLLNSHVRQDQTPQILKPWMAPFKEPIVAEDDMRSPSLHAEDIGTEHFG